MTNMGKQFIRDNVVEEADRIPLENPSVNPQWAEISKFTGEFVDNPTGQGCHFKPADIDPNHDRPYRAAIFSERMLQKDKSWAQFLWFF